MRLRGYNLVAHRPDRMLSSCFEYPIDEFFRRVSQIEGRQVSAVGEHVGIYVRYVEVRIEFFFVIRCKRLSSLLHHIKLSECLSVEVG